MPAHRAPLDAVCEVCNEAFHPRPASVRLGWGRYCSRACYRLRSGSFAERFWAKVDKNGPVVRPELGRCWIWTGARDQKGYGVIHRPGERKNDRAPRVSYRMHSGESLDGLEACHRCDNPPCVRPDHIFRGTTAQNAADRVAKGRGRSGKPMRGEDCPTAKLTWEAVREIRRRFEAGGVTHRELAKEFGVTRQAVSGVIRGQAWKE